MHLRSIELEMPDSAAAAAFFRSPWGLIDAGTRSGATYLRGTENHAYVVAVKEAATSAFASATFSGSKAEVETLFAAVTKAGLPHGTWIAEFDEPGRGAGFYVTGPEGEPYRFVTEKDVTAKLPSQPQHPLQLAHVVYIAHAKAQPGKIGYTSSGIGTQAHFAGMNLSAMTGISLLHVPYSNARLVQDVVSGDVPSTISIVSSVAPFIRSGRLRALAIASNKRIDALPGVPAASETIPGFEPPPTWTGLFAPARLPQPILANLHGSVIKGINAPEARAKAASDGFDLIGNTPEQFAAQIKRDIEVAGRLVKAAKIEPLD